MTRRAGASDPGLLIPLYNIPVKQAHGAPYPIAQALEMVVKHYTDKTGERPTHLEIRRESIPEGAPLPALEGVTVIVKERDLQVGHIWVLKKQPKTQPNPNQPALIPTT